MFVSWKFTVAEGGGGERDGSGGGGAYVKIGSRHGEVGDMIWAAER